MVDVPAATPVNIPVLPTVALVTALLLQLPPLVALASVVVLPMQVNAVPVIEAGLGLTVTTLVV